MSGAKTLLSMVGFACGSFLYRSIKYGKIHENTVKYIKML